MDLNQIMKLLNDPQMRQLVQGFLAQMGNGKGGAANLNGLLDQLSSSGLQQQVQSWVGTGQNQPITGQQLQEAVPGAALDQAAAAAHTTPEQAATDLAKVLPELVNTATPDGQLPDAQSLQDTLSKLLQPAGKAGGQ